MEKYPLEVSQELLLISEIALGLIGFDMGSHLHLNEIRKLGKSILFILIFEAFGAFFLVTAGIAAYQVIKGEVVQAHDLCSLWVCVGRPRAGNSPPVFDDRRPPLFVCFNGVVGLVRVSI